nr:sulfatase-like hydrolase/transferase [Leekyejoonella antrihumi]
MAPRRQRSPRHGFTHWYAHEAGGSAYHDAPMFRGGERESTPGYLTDALADDAVEFIRESAAQDDPFFLSLNFTAPHSPWKGQHPPEVEALYADCPFDSCPQGELHPWTTLRDGSPLGGEPDTRAALIGYFASVTAMDRALGRVVDALEDAGVRDNTVIVFSSDNGFNAGHHGIWGKGNGTWPLNMYDSSVKVPAIVSQPGRIAEGVVRSELLSAYDMGATLLELAGLDPTPMENGPGRSFASLLLASGDRQSAADADSARVVVFDEYGPARMIRSKDWKYIHRWPDGPNELYDLANDPGETVNLVEEAGQQDRCRQLSDELADWFSQYIRPEHDGQRLPVIGTGQAAPAGQPGAFQGPLWDSTAGESRD